MASIAEVVGYFFLGVASLNTVLQIVSSLSNEEFRGQLGTWIRDKVRDFTAPAPAPPPTINNNQTYKTRYVFTGPCHVFLTPGNGQAPEIYQIQGSRRPAQIAYEAASNGDSDDDLSS